MFSIPRPRPVAQPQIDQANHGSFDPVAHEIATLRESLNIPAGGGTKPSRGNTKSRRVSSSNNGTLVPESREIIEWVPKNLERISKKVVKILGTSTVFVLGSQLVELADQKIAPVINSNRLGAILTELVVFTYKDQPILPPVSMIQNILAMPIYPGICQIKSVSTAPVLRPDITWHCTPGYDPVTQRYYKADVGILAAGASKGEALAAVDKLLGIVSDYEFVSMIDKSAWLAALFTPFVRSAINGPAPMFLIDGNRKGVGKTMLADIIATLYTGESIDGGKISTQDREEVRKALTTHVLQGSPFLLFDDVTKKSLSRIGINNQITAPTYTDRRLGTNSQVKLPFTSTIFATGTNVGIHGDLTRRIQLISLCSTHPSPQDRDGFKYPNLIKHVQEARTEYISAVMTIFAAYQKAENPELPAWGSFEEWSSLVRGVLVWLGLPDPIGKATEVATKDSEVAAMPELLRQLKLIFGKNQWTSTDLNNRTGAEPNFHALWTETFPAQGNSPLSPNWLGRRLNQFVNQNHGGLTLKRRVLDGRFFYWIVG